MTLAPARGRRIMRRPSDAIVFPAALALTLSAIALSIAVGPQTLSPIELFTALTAPSGAPTDLIVSEVRLPRTLIGVAAGAALAVAGVMMQTITRNPLADPGILGVNSGAAFAVAIAVVPLGIRSHEATLAFAFVGAAITSLLVAALGGVGQRASIGRLTLSGVAIAAVLSAATAAISLLDPHGYAAMRLWEAGSLAGRSPDIATLTLGVVAAGLVMVLLISRGLSILALGDDTAKALGARTGTIQLTSLIAIALLCGTATAAAGPIGFIGLMVPHALRAIFGPDTPRLLLYSVLVGPALLLFADILGGVMLAPRTIPVGVVMAFLGAPLLIALVLSRRVQAEGTSA